MEKYLVTGGNGQVGSALKRELQDELNSYVKPRERLDITRAKRAITNIMALRADAVINCAAYTNVRLAEQERQQAWQVNAKAVQQVAYGLAQQNIPFIHVSTDFVFGAEGKRVPYKESNCVGPVGHYGWTKASGEHAIWQAAEKFPKWKFFIIRTAGVFERAWREPRNFPATIASRLARKMETQVVCDVHTNITFADDLARALVYFAENRGQIPRGCYHVTNAGTTTWWQVAEAVQDNVGTGRAKISRTTMEEFERRRGCDPANTAYYTCLDTEKYNNLPGAPVMPSWQSAIQTWASSWEEFS